MSRLHSPIDHLLFKSLDLGTLTTAAGNSIDTVGYGAAAFVLAATTAAASTFDSTLQESDDGATNWANVTGASIAQVVASQTRATRTLSVNLTGRKRYLRFNHTVTGTVTGQVSGLLFGADQLPVSQDNATLRV